MKELGIRQNNPRIGLAAVPRDRAILVVTYHEVICVIWVNPNVMKITSSRRRFGDERLASVFGYEPSLPQEIKQIFIAGRDSEATVVREAAAERIGVVDQFPLLSAVIGAVKPWGLIFDKCVNSFRVRLRDVHANPTQWVVRGRQTVARQLLPCRTRVVRHVNSAAGPSAVQIPCMDGHLPHARKECVGIVRIHDQVGTSGPLVDEKHLLPRLSAIGGLENAPLMPRFIDLANRADVDDVGVLSIDHNFGDVPGLLQSYVLPAVSSIRGLVNTIPRSRISPDDPRLSRSSPNIVRSC